MDNFKIYDVVETQFGRGVILEGDNNTYSVDLGDNVVNMNKKYINKILTSSRNNNLNYIIG